MRACVRGTLLALSLWILGPAPVLAQPAPAPTTAMDQARAHFEKGLALWDAEAWDAALVEFRRSRDLHPTRAATKNAALALRRLKRFDEALDFFEELARFPDLPAADRDLAQREMEQLRALVGSLDIKGAEPGAAVVIDGRARGTTPVSAPLRVSSGTHVVRVQKGGFAPFEARVEVASGQVVGVEARLLPLAAPESPSAAPPEPAPPERFLVEADAAFALSPSLGGDVIGSCSGSCSAPPSFGVLAVARGLYRFPSGFLLSVDAGYLMLTQKTTGRTATITASGDAPVQDKVDDSLSLHGFLVGASAGVQRGDRFPWILRLGAGVLLGSVTDHRTGTFTTVRQPLTEYPVDLRASAAAESLYLAPEARIGMRLGKGFEISVGVEGRLLFGLRTPSWASSDQKVDAKHDGVAEFPADALTGKVIGVIAPGIGVRYEL